MVAGLPAVPDEFWVGFSRVVPRGLDRGRVPIGWVKSGLGSNRDWIRIATGSDGFWQDPVRFSAEP